MYEYIAIDANKKDHAVHRPPTPPMQPLHRPQHRRYTQLRLQRKFH